MTFFADLIALTLAASAIVYAWEQGSFIENWRASVEAYKAFGRDAPLWSQLLNCAYCFSGHTALWPAVFLFAVLALCEPPYATLARGPIYGLAAWRLSWLLDGLLPPRLRYTYVETDDDRHPDDATFTTEIDL